MTRYVIPRLDPDTVVAANPVVVVEVLSPSTQSIGNGEKLADHFRLASIRHCLIVRARRREIIHHRRTGPEIVSRTINLGPIQLDPPGITINIAAIHDGTA